MTSNFIRIALAIILVVLGFLAYGSLYTVQETEQALVLMLGEPRRVIKEAADKEAAEEAATKKGAAKNKKP